MILKIDRILRGNSESITDRQSCNTNSKLSADGPMKEPYAVYFQGGLTYPHAKYGIIMSLQRMAEKGLVEIPEIS